MSRERNVATLKHSTLNSSTIARRCRQIQARWTPEERRQRQEWGRQGAQDLLQLIVAGHEPEIWAVGALDNADVSRLAS